MNSLKEFLERSNVGTFNIKCETINVKIFGICQLLVKLVAGCWLLGCLPEPSKPEKNRAPNERNPECFILTKEKTLLLDLAWIFTSLQEVLVFLQFIPLSGSG